MAVSGGRPKVAPASAFTLSQPTTVSELLEACNLQDKAAAGLAWCEEQGVDSLAMLKEVELEHAFADALELKPAKRVQLLKRLTTIGEPLMAKTFTSEVAAKPVSKQPAKPNKIRPPGSKAAALLTQVAKVREADTAIGAPAADTARVEVSATFITGLQQPDPAPESSDKLFGSRSPRDGNRKARVSELLKSIGAAAPPPPEAAQEDNASTVADRMDAKKPPLWGAVRKDNQKQRAESTANAAISMLDQLTFQPEIARSQFDIEAELLRKKFMEPKKRQQEGPTEYELDVLHNQTMALLDWVQQFKEGKWAEDSRCDNHRIDEAQQNLAKLVEEEAAVLAAGAAPAAEPLSLYKISITPQPPHQGAESEPRPEEVALCSRLEEVRPRPSLVVAAARLVAMSTTATAPHPSLTRHPS